MAKQGPSEAVFSPFAQIGQGIAALSKPVPVTQPTPQAKLEESREPAPIELQLKPAAVRPEAMAVVAHPQPVKPQPTAVRDEPSPTPALLTTKRFKVSPEESSEMELAAIRLAGKLGVKVDFSKITRALWQVYLRYEDDVLRNASSGMTRQRPSNDDSVGLAELDEQVAQVVSDGFMMGTRRNSRS